MDRMFKYAECDTKQGRTCSALMATCLFTPYVILSFVFFLPLSLPLSLPRSLPPSISLSFSFFEYSLPLKAGGEEAEGGNAEEKQGRKGGRQGG